ncbi:hypothetical protein [Petropleomorpha daqingensis]|uniref:Excreted virulence factor EspC, type VII ESX diderm n=1 Tax=Petropleomorpha daqingensis TaxID=2026353 RepID=A0A853CFU7_9ACTN|nr:hypothetical protein [Petropleomorpha daqingensis]NYJ06051.1 hypothetical protein [Petropleomorpha daqingensis]
MSALISVQLDAVAELAAELATLAVALAHEAPLCTSTVGSLATALGGQEGFLAFSAGSGWPQLIDAVADRAGAIAGTLSTAVDAYRTLDAGLAERISGRVGVAAIAR